MCIQGLSSGPGPVCEQLVQSRCTCTLLLLVGVPGAKSYVSSGTGVRPKWELGPLAMGIGRIGVVFSQLEVGVGRLEVEADWRSASALLK